MNEVTFLLAVLVKQDVLTIGEAKALQKSLSQSVTNSNLSEMITKVSKALEDKPSGIPTIDATTLLS